MTETVFPLVTFLIVVISWSITFNFARRNGSGIQFSLFIFFLAQSILWSFIAGGFLPPVRTLIQGGGTALQLVVLGWQAVAYLVLGWALLIRRAK